MNTKDSEVKKVLKSFELLKRDIEKTPLSFFSEFDLQGRLYYHLCNAFQSDYNRIHLEYTPPDFKYDKNVYKNKQKECIEKYVPNNIQYKINSIEKKGKYDLAILDKKKQKLLHVIELKKIKSYSDSNYHKGYEDIYLLTDLLDNQGCQSYFFVLAICNSKHGVKKEKMTEYIKYIDFTYKKSKKVYFDYYIYDKSD